ncbi:FAD binding domain-containing protein, partial [Chloroflexota bacterium]
ETIEEALVLLKEPGNIILGGGTHINTRLTEPANVVDIQDLELNFINESRNIISIGSYTTLQEIILNEFIPEAFKRAISIDAPLNIRNRATLGGSLVTASGTSSLATVLLAMDATIHSSSKDRERQYSDFMITPANEKKQSLIISVSIPATTTSFRSIAYTQFSRSFICASLSTNPSGKARLALGGYGNNPLLVMDGSFEDDIVSAARSAYLHAGDEWASSEYRSEMAAILTERCISDIRSINTK